MQTLLSFKTNSDISHINAAIAEIQRAYHLKCEYSLETNTLSIYSQDSISAYSIVDLIHKLQILNKHIYCELIIDNQTELIMQNQQSENQQVKNHIIETNNAYQQAMHELAQARRKAVSAHAKKQILEAQKALNSIFDTINNLHNL